MSRYDSGDASSNVDNCSSEMIKCNQVNLLVYLYIDELYIFKFSPARVHHEL